MSRSPRITGAQLIAALESVQFEVVRVRGSHHFIRHPDGRASVVPVHAGEIIGPGLLSRILRDCEITAERLSGILRRS
jgi:predicted RNA binding protein YcfA (HicA-like mRNA interferase family)